MPVNLFWAVFLLGGLIEMKLKNTLSQRPIIKLIIKNILSWFIINNLLKLGPLEYICSKCEITLTIKYTLRKIHFPTTINNNKKNIERRESHRVRMAITFD